MKYIFRTYNYNITFLAKLNDEAQQSQATSYNDNEYKQ